MTRASFALAAFAFVLPAVAQAQPKAPPPPANFFTDTAGVVSGDVAARIEARLREFQSASSNQVVVVVADRVPDGYTSMEEYTNRTAEAWRVGDKARDNGAVLFVFVGDRKIRIEVGYGLEGALPDALSSRIINDEIAPRFRSGDYGEGLLKGVEAIIAATKGEYQQVAARSTSGVSARTVFIILIILFFLFSGILLPFLREIQSISESRTYSGRGRRGGRPSSGWGSSSGWGGGWSGGGGGGGGSWGGGGGFSGGGGSFGGGGASGSW